MKLLYTDKGAKYRLIAILLLLLAGSPLLAQEKIVLKGTVRDATTNEPLVGVSILTGTPPRAVGITNANGVFSVSVAPDAQMIFRYMGFADYRFKVKDKRDVVIRLTVTENKLTEAIVVGYQKKTRELGTGSAAIVGGKELQDIPVSNVEQLLQGRVAGLNIQNNTGAPGARGSIQIRGLSNITVSGSGNDAFLSPTSPLYVIDGVPIEADANFEYGYQSAGPGVSPLSLIPPEDIESMEILKDAQATALYGSRGAYGVILITTRRGSSPIPLVRYTGNFFVNTPPQLRTTIGGKDERSLRIAEIFASGDRDDINKISTTPFLADSLNPYYKNSTNWQGIFYRSTYNQTHNVNISGGDPKFNYKVDLGYYHENGVIRNTGFDRYSINTNMLYQPNPKLRVFTTLSTQVGKRNKGDGNGLTQNGVAGNASASSLLPGPSFYQSTAGVLSSLTTKNDNKTANVRASVDVNYQLLKGLNAASTMSYDYASNTEDRFTPAAAHSDFSQVYAYNDRKFTLYNRNMLSYFYSLNGEHNFFLSTFNEIYNKGFQGLVIQQEKTPNNQYRGPLGFDGWASRGGGLLDNYSKQHIASFAGTFSYNYKQKYVLDLSYRLDGTSSTGFSDPYSRNPAVGVRWNFNKEALLKDSKWLTYGSLRGSWGQNIVPAGDIFSIYGTYNPRGLYNSNPRLGIDFGQLPNTTLKPTTTTQYNVGFEAGLFDSRIEVIFDAYYKSVKNLLRTKDVADMTGFNNITTNETSLIDYGYEATFTFRPLPRTSAVQWTISVNAAFNKDILTHLPNGAKALIQYDNASGQYILYRVGRNSLTNYLFKTNGVYASDADVPVDPATGLRYRTSGGTYFKGGDPIWQDVDGNYVMTNDDYTAAGNSQPLITGGLQSYLNWKNFSVNLSTSFTLIRSILNNALAQRMQYLGNPYDPKAVVDFSNVDYWKGTGNTATYPYPFDYKRAGQINPYRYEQTLTEEDGSYYKINTVTLAYLLNRKFTNRYGINSVRFYLSCNNLVTFSNYSGPNPENVSALGRDQSGGYPIPRSWNFGLNVEF
ncbi:SusC/RagA family TonB-linked outer membrane protein [Chitinophaga polysaccharea]|uniref:SusC/RagA family TonB-linked outer membrane protein n=1 Tax=Chitinophaga polysaccharea TaxID=1293035 RepID=UPI00145558A1|nr:SusC/RagA family TonB-linked outer membrane protein [Chitinophaga polysaccharea]NLR59485.1 SusC/RagA family TonB-linked outer membrane protein [Chitinophaga polysaccharea]